MDGQQFDRVARALAREGVSRRALLRGLGGALLGGIVGHEGTAAYVCRQGGATCLKDAQCCSGRCDPGSHRCACPAGQPLCGMRCCAAGQVCQGGQCVTPCTPTTCGAQNAACGSIPDGCGGTLQCGGCPGAACSTGSCQQGNCVLTPIAGCCTGDGDCNDGDACTVDTCVGNTCQHAALGCQASDACHTASCDPTLGCVQTAVANGADCGNGQTCQNGTCGCPSGTVDCNGTCQQCCTAADCPGTTCSPATCTNGACGRAPITGCCTVDTDCGDGNACTTDTCDTTNNTCQHAAAAPGTTCGTNQVCCGTTCCAAGLTCQNGSCAACTPKTCINDYAGQCGTFDNGCGSTMYCGCGYGSRCSSGQCIAASCFSDSDCTAGGSCQRGACQLHPGGGGSCRYTNNCAPQDPCHTASCATGTCVQTPVSCGPCKGCNIYNGDCVDNCPPCQKCNGTQCVADTSLNHTNVVCPDGQECYNGQCVSCLADNSDCLNSSECCSGECNLDPNLQGGYICRCRAAVIESCTADIQCCSRCCAIVPGLSGVCVDTTEDPNNCGTCGRQCASGDICMNGQCCDFFGNNCS